MVPLLMSKTIEIVSIVLFDLSIITMVISADGLCLGVPENPALM